jgi:hypothetical protein
MNRSDVEKVVNEFFDADYVRDADRLDKIFHEGSEFFALSKEGVLIRRTGKEFVNGFRNPGATHQEYPRFNEILSIDFTGENTAVARTKMRVGNTMYTDILCLMCINGVWGIIAKIASGVPIEE